MEYYKQLRKNKKAILRLDKLFTNNGVFTYDLQQQMIIRLDTPLFQWWQAAGNTQNTTKSRGLQTLPTTTVMLWME